MWGTFRSIYVPTATIDWRWYVDITRIDNEPANTPDGWVLVQTSHMDPPQIAADYPEAWKTRTDDPPDPHGFRGIYPP